MTPLLPPPFQQGDLDGLCGAYAIINVARLTSCRHLPKAAWRGLFEALVQRLHEAGELDDAVSDGIGARRLRGLLDDACTWLSAEHGL
jgi:hypothetical protein